MVRREMTVAVDPLGVVGVAAEVDRGGGRGGAGDGDAERSGASSVGEAGEDGVEVGAAAGERSRHDAAAEVALGHAHATGRVAPRPAHVAVAREHDLGRAAADVDHRDLAGRRDVGGDAGEGQLASSVPVSTRGENPRRSIGSSSTSRFAASRTALVATAIARLGSERLGSLRRSRSTTSSTRPIAAASATRSRRRPRRDA